MTPAGQPVAGASAFVPEVGGQVTAISGKDGSFLLTGLAPGTWYVRVVKEGYLAGSFRATVTSGAPAQLVGQLELTAGNLHKGGVPNLCADCHVLHDPTPNNHLMKGASVNTSCFAAGCHAPLGNGPTIDESTYRNSPHGPAWTYNSNTVPVLTGQPASDRGNCNTCHEPHGISGPPFMLKVGTKDADGTLHLNDLCYQCHTAAGTGNTAGWPGKDAYIGAGNAHANLVDNSLPRKYAPGDCSICHVPHGQTFDGANYEPMTRTKGLQLCAKCHPGRAATDSGHGKCTVCHDPHETGTAAAPKVKNPTTGVRYTVSKSAYRIDTVLPDAYCISCHAPSPPAGYATAKDPFDPATNFVNSAPLAWQRVANLHIVHVQRVWAAGVKSPYTGITAHSVSHYGDNGDNNRVRCNQCHRVHQRKTGDPALPYNLGPRYVSWISRPYSGNIGNSKVGCRVTNNCHTCEWCHASPGNPKGSACWSCSWHENYTHSGVDY